MRILALDLAQSKTVVCDYHTENGKYSFMTIRTREQQIHDLMVKRAPDRVVIEVCSIAGWVYDLVVSLGIEVQVANPTHEAWRWKNVKKKNDREDALKLAQLSAMNQLPTVHMPKREVRQWRALIQYRQRLIRQRTQVKNRIRALLRREGLSLPAGKSGWSRDSLESLREMSQPLASVSIDQLWRGQLWVEMALLESVEGPLAEVTDKLDKLAAANEQVRLLRTAPGVGVRLAETIVAYLDEPSRFSNGKQVGSYAGLTPKQYQSGQMDHQGHISGQGNRLLRSLLVEVSWCGLRYNPWVRQTYERIRRGSESRKKIAITAVARKLLVRCWAMLREEQEWRENNRSPVDEVPKVV